MLKPSDQVLQELGTSDELPFPRSGFGLPQHSPCSQRACRSQPSAACPVLGLHQESVHPLPVFYFSHGLGFMLDKAWKQILHSRPVPSIIPTQFVGSEEGQAPLRWQPAKPSLRDLSPLLSQRAAKALMSCAGRLAGDLPRWAWLSPGTTT